MKSKEKKSISSKEMKKIKNAYILLKLIEEQKRKQQPKSK